MSSCRGDEGRSSGFFSDAGVGATGFVGCVSVYQLTFTGPADGIFDPLASAYIMHVSLVNAKHQT